MRPRRWSRSLVMVGLGWSIPISHPHDGKAWVIVALLLVASILGLIEDAR